MIIAGAKKTIISEIGDNKESESDVNTEWWLYPTIRGARSPLRTPRKIMVSCVENQGPPGMWVSFDM